MPLDPNYGQRAQTSRVEGWRDARATRQLVVFLLVVIVAVALWPLAVAYEWLTSVHGLPDPLGFTSFVMSVRPILAGAAALSCPIVLFLVVISHPQRASETLLKAALAVGVAVLAILLLSPLINGFLADWSPRSQPWWASEPVVPAAEIIARENAAVVSAIVPLVGIAVAFAVIAALSRSAPAPSLEVDDATAAVDRIFGQRPPSPGFGEPRDAPPQPPSAAAKAFKERTYRVRPRPQLLLGLRKFFDDYEIRGIRQEHFSYNMTSGALTRASDGAVIFSVSRRAGALTDTFDVVDSETGRPVGRFRSRATGWDINDTLGRTVLFVIRDIEESNRVRYIASVPGGEVCRYTWSFGPFGLFNVAVDIEFASGGPAFDRALAVALGPFIEEEARLLTEELRRVGGD